MSINFTSIGDLATRLMLSHRRVDARQNLNILAKELTTGITTNVSKQLHGDYASLAGWHQTIEIGEARAKTLSEQLTHARIKAETIEASRAELSIFANDLATVQSYQSDAHFDRLSEKAKGLLETFVGRINTRSGHQALFAGTATDSSALASAEDILNSAIAAVSGAATFSDVHTRLEQWLSGSNNGYQSQVYLGSTNTLRTVRLNDETIVSLPGKADQSAIRDTIRHLVTAAISTDPSLGFSKNAQSQLLGSASLGLRSSEGALTNLQAELGHIQSRIETAMSETQTKVSTAKQVKLTALAVDPYETATRLQNAELQLEKIYALTARSSRMSLLEYLR